MIRRLAVVVMAAPLSVSACGGSSTDSVSPSSSHAIHRVTDKDNGTVVVAHVGDALDVTLHSTYWQLVEPAGSVLTVSTPPSPSPGGSGCPSMPGTGCGTVVADYQVAAAGDTHLVAHRTSCGEALRCTGSTGSWSVTVRASG